MKRETCGPSRIVWWSCTRGCQASEARTTGTMWLATTSPSPGHPFSLRPKIGRAWTTKCWSKAGRSLQTCRAPGKQPLPRRRAKKSRRPKPWPRHRAKKSRRAKQRSRRAKKGMRRRTKLRRRPNQRSWGIPPTEKESPASQTSPARGRSLTPTSPASCSPTPTSRSRSRSPPPPPTSTAATWQGVF